MIKVEDKPVQKKDNRNDTAFHEFLITLRDMKVGQSFLVESLPSHYRLGISIVQVLLGDQISTRKDGDMIRVGKTA